MKLGIILHPLEEVVVAIQLGVCGLILARFVVSLNIGHFVKMLWDLIMQYVGVIEKELKSGFNFVL